MVNNDALMIKIFLNILRSSYFLKNNQILSDLAGQANLVSLQNRFTKSFAIVVSNNTNFEEDFLKAIVLIQMKYISMSSTQPFCRRKE